MRTLIKQINLIIFLVFIMIFVTACGSAPDLSQSEITTTPIMSVSSPTSHPTTVASIHTKTNPTPTISQQTEQDETDPDSIKTNTTEANLMNIQIGDTLLLATLVENSSTDALVDALSKNPITVDMRDYGNMEKVGSLGMDFPRNDEQITTEPGDIILFQGNMLVIYYAPNSWNFTRLGKIYNINAEELREILGDGDVTITISLQQE